MGGGQGFVCGENRVAVCRMMQERKAAMLEDPLFPFLTPGHELLYQLVDLLRLLALAPSLGEDHVAAHATRGHARRVSPLLAYQTHLWESWYQGGLQGLASAD